MTAEGETYAEFETDRFNVTELLDAAGDGSAVVLHAGADNFANIPTTYSTTPPTRRPSPPATPAVGTPVAS